MGMNENEPDSGNRAAAEATCPLKLAMEIAGGKWKSSIVCLLSDGTPRRFSEIRRVMPVVTNTMLSQSLKELESGHIIERIQYNEMPVRVEYRITQDGKELQEALDRLNRWSRAYMEKHPECGTPLCGECSFGKKEEKGTAK